jgi:1-acyl-sn-glycerol-3-phosphate acyltransferase
MVQHAVKGLSRWRKDIPFRMRGWPGKGMERIKYQIRCRLTGLPFAIAQSTINWDIHGVENLIGALRMAESKGKGVIVVSNHRALYDDPLIYMGMFKLFNFTYPIKCWNSTADKMNFNPPGNSRAARFTRYFFEPSNMIYLERAKNRNGKPPTVNADPLSYLKDRLDERTMMSLRIKAQLSGKDLGSYLRGYLTHGEDSVNGKFAAINQVGLLEAIAKADGGQWVHLFPEGTRSRTIYLGDPKPGVGKAIYHAKDAVVVPFVHHGMHKVSPIGKLELLPRPFKTVVVNVGRPIPAHKFEMLRAASPTMETFARTSEVAMDAIRALRPFVLERYYGLEKAQEILREEAALEIGVNPTRAWEASGPMTINRNVHQA